MLFMKIIAVYFENHAQTINKSYGQNVELFSIRAGGTQNYNLALKC